MRISRRRFIIGSLTAAGALVLGSMVPRIVIPSFSEAGVPSGVPPVEELKKTLPYAPLDPDEVRKRAYYYYHKHLHCGAGVFAAFVTSLREKVGGPWNNVPVMTLYWQKGGGEGWSVLCGALAGAASIISLVYGENKMAGTLINDLFRWYELHPFPSWTPDEETAKWAGAKVLGPLPRSVCFSVLCHVSVTRWCLTAKKASCSPERSERCARLAGEVAYHAAKILNAAYAGKFKPTVLEPLVVDPKYGCRSCHRKGVPYSEGGFTRGKMYCITCHRAPHLKLVPQG